MIKVPLLDLSMQNGALAEELTAAFQRVLNSCCFIMGPELENFEKNSAAFCEAKHGLGVSSGTDAILLALMALDIKAGDEVLVPAFTFFASGGCVARLGATPIWVDVDPHTFNIDLADAAQKVSSRTKAVMPVHLFGQAADMDAVMSFAKKYNLRVVEDCAQSIGAKWKGRNVGTFGDFGAFSFFPSKNLGGFGDGGLVTTSDPDLFQRARILRVHGMDPKYYHSYIGANFRMDALQAALLSVKLPHLSGYNRKRVENAAYYRELLKTHPLVSDNIATAPDSSVILLPCDLSGGEAIWNQFTLRIRGEGKRNALRAHLVAKNIGCDIYYPLSLDQQVCFQEIGQGGETIKVSHQLGHEVLSIPVYPELSQAQKETVVEAIIEWLNTQKS
ncbi:MAG: DegT/DnrJ/EryC1/StrS family aminotransferase [Puniceicoccales bacterium]|jgi:dTDP-4-amino-4,6-dideoxygalactose transaminase|nr:DegT/DnrJ/EryC1/StrS family aminotransferase [Puniceicoccales bacterium]